MKSSRKVKVELTKKEIDYISGMIESHRGRLQVFEKETSGSKIIDKEISLASKIGKKFTVT